MEKKIVLKKQKQSKATKPVFIDIELHEQLLDLKSETGIPIGKLVGDFIKYGIENTEIEGEDE